MNKTHMKMFNIIINDMAIIWRRIVSALMLLRYFYNPLLVFFFIGSVLFLLIIDRNRSVYEEIE
ncbi:unnamed protein product, partial [Thlaspi arvense]